MQEIIEELQRKYEVDLITPSEDRKMLLEFRRDFILEDALRQASKKKFNPQKTLKVHVHYGIATDAVLCSMSMQVFLI